jgi:hypothetical protein
MATFSSGTYTYNVINLTTGTTGTCLTCLSTLQPHPVYSRPNGDDVVQLTSVTIGGFNGLNS